MYSGTQVFSLVLVPDNWFCVCWQHDDAEKKSCESVAGGRGKRGRAEGPNTTALLFVHRHGAITVEPIRGCVCVCVCVCVFAGRCPLFPFSPRPFQRQPLRFPTATSRHSLLSPPCRPFFHPLHYHTPQNSNQAERFKIHLNLSRGITPFGGPPPSGTAGAGQFRDRDPSFLTSNGGGGGDRNQFDRGLAPGDWGPGEFDASSGSTR